MEDIGCTVAAYNSPVSIILGNIPPILIGLVTAYYAVLAIMALNRRRVKFNDLAQHSNLNSSFYLRLMCFGGLEILGTIPVASYFLYLGIVNGVRPWISWDYVHSNFSNVLFVPRSVWAYSRFKTSYELGRWVSVICAFNFFAFFGFAKEARMNYRAVYLTVAKRIGLSTKPSGSPQPGTKRNDIEALTFAHTTTTNVSIPIPDGENHIANKKGPTPQVNAPSANTFLDADANNFHLYPIPPTLPEPAVTRS